MSLQRAFDRFAAQAGKTVRAAAAFDAALLGEFIADVLMRGRQPDRLFTLTEINTATETACALNEQGISDEDIAAGVPRTIAASAAVLGPADFRARVRRSLCAALPASLIATEGVA